MLFAIYLISVQQLSPYNSCYAIPTVGWPWWPNRVPDLEPGELLFWITIPARKFLGHYYKNHTVPVLGLNKRWTALHLKMDNRSTGFEDLLTLDLLNLDIPCLRKQCRCRSVGFFRSQLIWICTVCHSVCEYIHNLDQVIWLAENWKWARHLNLFSMTRVKINTNIHKASLIMSKGSFYTYQMF